MEASSIQYGTALMHKRAGQKGGAYIPLVHGGMSGQHPPAHTTSLSTTPPQGLNNMRWM